jgi:hypothetical protein
MDFQTYKHVVSELHTAMSEGHVLDMCPHHSHRVESLLTAHYVCVLPTATVSTATHYTLEHFSNRNTRYGIHDLLLYLLLSLYRIKNTEHALMATAETDRKEKPESQVILQTAILLASPLNSNSGVLWWW